MSSTARDRIFARLHAARTTVSPYVPQGGNWQAPMLDKAQRIELLKKRMETVRSEVHVVPEAEWPAKLLEVLKTREAKTLTYGHDAWFGGTLRSKIKGKGLPKLVPYGENVEAFRDELFGIDVGITSTLGGIAENGTLIVWPTPQEPRLLSLVPTVHVALLKADTIYSTLAEAMREMRWAEGMPTNALLISGPSKTADIEMTLAFGVHGPKELIVLVLE
ncbi:lactate utilization protein [Nitratidesulfovibrio sp. HK-II]|uniref:LutC/YkgG family protein n=1 Tax=Nitratidesulfovibrio sp. HK-II TaxID=2009266 RepID=UPI000E2F1242|nr:lactate utilization protein [Nitratidesulfovibrio sp. HK-II]GBO95901.1 predicted L-lactate dehydrogenase [Nitratidesulfovibrio sp. HK-II]